MISKKLLRNEERAILTLRALYRKHGFLPHKMNKFEEYEFYIENKDFLMADRIATFYDTNGKLMALRPDVTLSIIKNNEFIPGVKQRVYYDESVYRAYGSSRQIREIKQVGLECVGDLDLFDISETLLLAGESLAKIADDFVISISHLRILNSILQETCTDSEFTRKALNYIKAKNAHDIEKLCMKYRVPEAAAQRLCSFVSLYGRIEEILPQLSLLCTSEEAVEGLEEIKTLYQIIKDTPYKDNFVVDFSIVDDMDYYNNIVFQGFIKGISENGALRRNRRGIRTMETVKKYLDSGVSRVILGTAAVTDEEFLIAATSKYGSKVAVGADIKDGYVAIKGWLEKSPYTLDQFMEKTADLAYNAMVLMVEMGITVEDVHRELASRHIIDHKVKQEKMV